MTIEQNVFDVNRYAIAGGSRDGDALDYSGYTARDNLLLAGGGRHCADSGGTGAAIGGVVLGILFGIIGGVIGGVVLGGLPAVLIGIRVSRGAA
jgi:hypothetical protein